MSEKKYIVLAHGVKKRTLSEAKREIRNLKGKECLPYTYYIYELKKVAFREATESK